MQNIVQLFQPTAVNRLLQPNRRLRKGPIHYGPLPAFAMYRFVYLQRSVSLWAWPSRGGLIVLERATAIDMDLLGLDPVHPSPRRDPDQEAEDHFCQQLLQLGARWFDSRQRYQLVSAVANEEERFVEALEMGEEEELTPMEKSWFCVGISSNSPGGFWVAEYLISQPHLSNSDNPVPRDAAKVLFARTMDERCEILKDMGAPFFSSMEQYEGAGCFKAWVEKTTGEHGPLIQEPYVHDSVPST